MQYRKAIILLLSLSLLINCRGYSEFNEAIFHNHTTTQNPNTEGALQPLSSLMGDQINGYWLAENNQVRIYPHLWQSSSTQKHTLDLDQNLTLVHAPFQRAYLDYLSFADAPQERFAALKSISSNAQQQVLEVYQLQANQPSLLFRLATSGEIQYTFDERTAHTQYISVYSQGQQSDQIDYYYFDVGKQQFFLERSEVITHDTNWLSMSQLEDFLAGPWQMQNAQGQAPNMIVFMPKEQQILFMQERVELYTWRSLTRRGNNQINIQAHNLQVGNISANSAITILDAQTIDFSPNTANSGIWHTAIKGGRYTRVNLQQDQINNQGPQAIAKQEAPFSGAYRSQNGITLDFNYPLFEHTDSSGRMRTGSMALFELDNMLIMQLRYRNSYGIVEEQMNYEVDFSQDNSGSYRVRLLQLKPTRFFVFGSYPLPQSVVERFEQIEPIR